MSHCSSQEPDFAENELIYEDLDLEEVQTGIYGTAAGTLSEGGGVGEMISEMVGMVKGEVWTEIIIFGTATGE